MKKLILILSMSFSVPVLAQYNITTLISGLTNPIAFDIAPDGRFFITLKEGLLQAFDSNGVFLQTVYNISDSTYDAGECGLLGICLDPQFSINHYIYLYYNHFDSNATAIQPRIRVLRITESTNLAINPIMLLDIPELGNNHVGGNIHFSKTGTDKLFISIGENTIMANAQLTDNPYGKILRINADGSIPTDNPFFDDGNPLTGNDDRIWAYGLRNSFDFTFSPLTDSLYATENGPFQDDEINIIHAGANYAWPNFTGITNNVVYSDPIFTWTPTVAPTGILFYDDTLFPQFKNHLLVSIFNQGFIYDLTLGNPPYFDTVVASSISFNFGAGITHSNLTLKQGQEGCLYALHGGFVIGDIFKICPLINSIVEQVSSATPSFTVYPVPASNHLLVSFPDFLNTSCTLLVYNMFGQQVFTENIFIRQSELLEHKINLQAYENGIYFIKIKFTTLHGNIFTLPKKFIICKNQQEIW